MFRFLDKTSPSDNIYLYMGVSCSAMQYSCFVFAGDQPKGKMYFNFNDDEDCVGYEGKGRIEIIYKFPDGKQGVSCMLNRTLEYISTT